MNSHSFNIGDVMDGEISGIQNYGVFVQISDEIQGLVHISECKHGFVANLDDNYKIGEKVKVKIIDIDEYSGKISLSFRALQSINVPPFPKRQKRYPKRNLPSIGFKTLSNKLPVIIKNGLKVIEQDKFNHYTNGGEQS